MKLFLITVSMIVAVTLNCNGHFIRCIPPDRVLPDPKPPQPKHQPQATNSSLESKYLNATTLVTTGTSAKGVPIATKLSSKRLNVPCSSFGGQCIIFYDDHKTWDQAVTSCEAKGQRLAVLQDPVAFNAYMQSNHDGESYWLGGSDKDQEGTWTSINGQSLAGFPWGPGQPDDWRGDEDCLEWGWGSNWNDGPCTYAKPYICEPEPDKVYKPLNMHVVSDVERIMRNLPFYIWRVREQEGYYRIGDIPVIDRGDSNEPVTGFVLSLSDPTDRESLRLPTSYTEIWNDKTFCSIWTGTIWRAECPVGYIALGNVVTRRGEIYPKPTACYCVNYKYVLAGSTKNWRFVWRSSTGFPPHLKNVMIYEAVGTSDTQQATKGIGSIGSYDDLPGIPYFLNTESINYIT